MNAKQLCQRLGRSNRGNGDWASRRVKIGVGSWNRPRSCVGTELPFLDREIERREQLGRKHGCVEPRIHVRLYLAQCFSFFAYIKSKLLEVSIIRFGQQKRVVEREQPCPAPLSVSTREQAQCCDE